MPGVGKTVNVIAEKRLIISILSDFPHPISGL
jgi:hypothetical protein